MKSLPLQIAGLLALAAPLPAQDLPVLEVYTYDSFVTEWGPGPAVEAAFEADCACDVRFTAQGDGAALLARLRLEGGRTDADIVLGLDTNLIAAARGTGLFAPHGMSPDLDLPVDWDDPDFLPYDWGWFAFVANVGTNLPESLEELAASDLSIVIQDPRSSTPGLGLVLWVAAAYPDRAEEIWAELADNIVTVTPGWSEAYGLFTDAEVDAVLSYTTSPSYHLLAEDDDGKVAMIFDEGHALQIEVAGKVASTDQPDLADDFLAFMLTDGFQGAIATTNWMFPAVTPAGGLPDGFADPAAVPRAIYLTPEEAAELRDPAIDAWRAALSR